LAQSAESQDATLLQRRARRRLVGAIALVVLVVIVLPIVLDKEPSPVGQDLVIQIPSQEAGRFNTRVLPPSAPSTTAPPGDGAEGAKPAPAKEETPPGPRPAEGAAASAVPAKKEQPAVSVEGTTPPVPETAKKGPPSPAPTGTAKEDSEAQRAKALLEGKEAWVVRLGAYSNAANVKQLRDKLTAAGVKSFTEAAKGPKGEQTRVRAGPFDSRLEAEQAQEKLTAAGVSPGTVGPR